LKLPRKDTKASLTHDDGKEAVDACLGVLKNFRSKGTECDCRCYMQSACAKAGDLFVSSAEVDRD
jgi:hypothetical protein